MDLKDPTRCPNGREVSVAGIVLVRQRPATASGVVFMTLEDETSGANLVVWPKVYAQYRREAGHSVAIIAHGTVQREGEVVHIVVKRVEDISGDLPGLTPASRDFH
jgi:error-prone DNA polymerase